MFERINFSRIQVGMFTYDDWMIKVASVNTEGLIDCIIVKNGQAKTMTGVTSQELQKELCPFSDEPVKHKQFDKIVTVLRDGMSVYLYGAAGTGKNVLCQQIADELGLTFYFANSVQDRFDLLGYGDANGKFVETEFYKAFTEGGLFMLDEMHSLH